MKVRKVCQRLCCERNSVTEIWLSLSKAGTEMSEWQLRSLQINRFIGQMQAKGWTHTDEMKRIYRSHVLKFYRVRRCDMNNGLISVNKLLLTDIVFDLENKQSMIVWENIITTPSAWKFCIARTVGFAKRNDISTKMKRIERNMPERSSIEINADTILFKK